MIHLHRQSFFPSEGICLVQEFFSFLAVVFASITAAYSFAYISQLKSLRSELQDKIQEFAKITKAASDANTSIADKLISMDQRIDNIDSWRSMTAASQNNGWKK